jgi:hypothetical protein
VSTVPLAIDLQIKRSADYESLTLNIHRYSYLSGLDGEVPGDDSMKAGRGENPKTNVTAKDALVGGLQERPEGTSQLDYVRALATRIQDEGEGAKAIGILGTDPYDALLILKALRPAFPHAVFFTVDLDARHLHASEYKWTRNMVVTSPFGLQLDGGLQRDVPRFGQLSNGHLLCRAPCGESRCLSRSGRSAEIGGALPVWVSRGTDPGRPGLRRG